MSIYKKLRESQNVSQQSVAVSMGLSLTAYRNKENGRSKFYAEEITAFSKAIGLDSKTVLESIFLNK